MYANVHLNPHIEQIRLSYARRGSLPWPFWEEPNPAIHSTRARKPRFDGKLNIWLGY
jgi:hypothetical protein